MRPTFLFMIAVAALTFGVADAAVPGTAPSFSAAKAYEAGEGPESAALGDVNGDTKTDVADVFSLINFLFAGGPAPK